MSASSMVVLVGDQGDGDHAPSSQVPRCQSLGDGFAYPTLSFLLSHFTILEAEYSTVQTLRYLSVEGVPVSESTK
jgi:hypothetical protein